MSAAGSHRPRRPAVAILRALGSFVILGVCVLVILLAASVTWTGVILIIVLWVALAALLIRSARRHR